VAGPAKRRTSPTRMLSCHEGGEWKDIDFIRQSTHTMTMGCAHSARPRVSGCRECPKAKKKLSQGLCVIEPDGRHEYAPLPDPMTTTVCFGADGLRTAYVTLSGTGRPVALDCPRTGPELAFSG
jgi:hypothetical protein